MARQVATPTQKTCEEVAALMGIALQRTVKSVAVTGLDAEGGAQFVLALVRGDHVVNEIKLAKVPGLADYRLATEAEIAEHLGSEPGFLGPLGPRKAIRVHRRPQRRGDGGFRDRRQRGPASTSRASIGAATCRAGDVPTSATWWLAMPRPMARVRSASRAASKSGMCSSSARKYRSDEMQRAG
jgi:hypothetical protein